MQSILLSANTKYQHHLRGANLRISSPVRNPVTAQTATNSLFFFCSRTRRYPSSIRQKRQRYPRGSPARVIPSPGTDFRKSLDLRAVKPPRSPRAPQRQLAREMSVPSPQQMRSWSQTSYSWTRWSTSFLPRQPLTTALVAMSPRIQGLVTKRESWSTTRSRGRQWQKGFSNMSPAKANPVKQCWSVELEMEKQRSTTFSGSACSLAQKKKAERANSSERYFFPGLNFTPYYMIYSFWIVRGSFSRTTFCSKVRGYATALPPSGLRRRFSISRLMMSVLIPHLLRLSSTFIIIIAMGTGLLCLLLLLLPALLAAEDDFLRFWPANASLHPAPVVPRTLFVTSWNAQGRRAAIHHASKFESVVLCLYDLRFEEKQFRLEKLVEIESSFLKDLRAANPAIKVFLRIFVVGSARSLFEYVSSSTKKIAQVAAGIVRAMRREKANGVYFDSPFNLPLRFAPAPGPYDKFAALLNSYIANKVKELLWESEQLLFGVRVGTGEGAVAEVDLAALRMVKADAMIVEALDSKADLSLMNALSLIKEIRATVQGKAMEYYVAVPLCSWRNSIGVKTAYVKENLEKNGIAFKGFRHGLCLYVQRVGGAESVVPCEHYLQVVRRYAYEMGVKVGYFEAGDAVEKQFEMI